MTPIERAAKAFHDASREMGGTSTQWDWDDPEYRHVRAAHTRLMAKALEALHEPSEAMLVAGAQAYADAFADWNTELLEASGWRGEFLTWAKMDDHRRSEYRMLIGKAFGPMITAAIEEKPYAS